MQEERTTEVHNTVTDADGAPVERRVVTRSAQPSGVVVAQRVVWFIVGVIDALIAIRFVLLLLAANQQAGFVDFIYGVTSALVAPFTGIFGEPTYGHFTFEVSSLLAIVIYTLIGWGIAKLITLARPRDEV